MNVKPIKDAIEEMKLSERELARMIGVSNSTVSRICNGEAKSPHWDVVCKITDALNIDLCDLR